MQNPYGNQYGAQYGNQYASQHNNQYGYGNQWSAEWEVGQQSVQTTQRGPLTCPTGFLYTVVPGDTFYQIATRFGLTVQQLVRANPQVLNPAQIFPGQLICVPGVGAPTVPAYCRVLLEDTLEGRNRGVLGGTAFVNLDAAEAYVAGFRLPSASTFGSQYRIYKAWIENTETGNRFSFELLPTRERVWVGYAKGTGSWVNYDNLIITPEVNPAVTQPTGPVIMRGSLTACP